MSIAKTADSLSAKLKEGTESQHLRVHQSPLMKDFVRRKFNHEVYALLLTKLYFVYECLEASLSRHNLDNDIIQKVNIPKIHRLSHIEKDLCFFLGDKWADLVFNLSNDSDNSSTYSDDDKNNNAYNDNDGNNDKQYYNHSSLHKDANAICFYENIKGARNSPGVMLYLNRLNEITRTKPFLLVAHVYVRYLGDLSGGQVLKRIVRKALNLQHFDVIIDDNNINTDNIESSNSTNFNNNDCVGKNVKHNNFNDAKDLNSSKNTTFTRNSTKSIETKHFGTNFYSFPLLDNINTFKSDFKNLLNELPFSEKQQNELVIEAQLAFDLNYNLMSDIVASETYQYAKRNAT
eukprot:Awhi_evm1s5431